VAEKRGSELVFQDVRACRSRAGISPPPARHPASSGQSAYSPNGGRPPWRGPVSSSGMPGKPKHLGVPNGRMVSVGSGPGPQGGGGHTQGGAQEAHPAELSRSPWAASR
jgi:hypothetical protein